MTRATNLGGHPLHLTNLSKFSFSLSETELNAFLHRMRTVDLDFVH